MHRGWNKHGEEKTEDEQRQKWNEAELNRDKQKEMNRDTPQTNRDV
jgi:hypothetical protein